MRDQVNYRDARKYLYNLTFSCFLFYESNFCVTKLFTLANWSKNVWLPCSTQVKKVNICPWQRFSILLSKHSMVLHSHNPNFCSDCCILLQNIAQVGFCCVCATKLWMHALFTAEHQHSPNYFLIFQSSSAFLLLVLALSRLVVEKHKLFKSLERQWKRKVVHMIMILLFPIIIILAFQSKLMIR